MNQEKIGKFIAECRKEKNLTQEQLAEKLGVSDKSISRWENAKTMPDISLFEPLCQELDISFNELLTGEKHHNDESNQLSNEALIGYERYIRQKNRIVMIFLSVITFLALSLSALIIVLALNKTFFGTTFNPNCASSANIPIPRFSYYMRTGGMDETTAQLKTLKQPDEINVFIDSYLNTLQKIEYNDEIFYYDSFNNLTIIRYTANNDGTGFINTIYISYCNGNICDL
ncbi:MAG: helix-turn-helix transcriptional regulator [Ruminococcaceae bacterium]|nr:helix-turn-helix transcriptional regulator [Oscillospiraceae bacterium]